MKMIIIWDWEFAISIDPSKKIQTDSKKLTLMDTYSEYIIIKIISRLMDSHSPRGGRLWEPETRVSWEKAPPVSPPPL